MSELITEIDILKESKDCFMTYSEEVLTDRAIPSVEDGLLSVQRKILWTAEEVLKMSNKSKYKKSASLVGSTLSTSYFHGDSSCYGALCKMAQTYLMRYPLIDGDGNFGTQEGNGMEAAARYTNARPSQYADIMMNDFKKNVVPLKETYNGEYYEPVVLPSIFPNAMVNGRQAIGISMAHNSLPMNLSEVCNAIVNYISKKGDITVDEVMEDIKGPDFPLGGAVINGKDIKYAFEHGISKVSLKVRGDYEIKDGKIIFTSIPYRTYRDKIKEQIRKNIDELDKYIEDFNDESNVGNNKLIFHVKKGINENQALEALFAYTDLQTSLSYNMNFIVKGTPRLCSILDLLKGYVEHQIEIIIKATEFDMKKAKERLHILKGLMIAIEKIDAVIALIKQSENKTDARNKLIDFLSIDEIQANAILDMKLSRLSKLEKDEIRVEIEEKEKFILECQKILTDEDERYKILKEKVLDMKKKYGDNRRTKILDIEVKNLKSKSKEPVSIIEEDCVVITTTDDKIKIVDKAEFKTQKRNSVGKKANNYSFVSNANTLDTLCVFTNMGKFYRFPVHQIAKVPLSDAGVYINTYIKLGTGEKVLSYVILNEDKDKKDSILFVTKEGYVKRTSVIEYMGVKRTTGIKAINLGAEDEIKAVFLAKNDEDIFISTKSGMAVKFNTAEVPISGRIARGVKGINLKEGDGVKAALSLDKEGEELGVFTLDGFCKIISSEEVPIHKRGAKGVAISKENEISTVLKTKDRNKIIISGNNNSLTIEITEIPHTSRVARGVKIFKKDNIVLSVAAI